MGFRLSNFDDFCAGAKCTPTERDQLAWHLAMFRARRTYEELMKCPSTRPARAAFRKA
jgi:hypothetical protein